MQQYGNVSGTTQIETFIIDETASYTLADIEIGKLVIREFSGFEKKRYSI